MFPYIIAVPLVLVGHVIWTKKKKKEKTAVLRMLACHWGWLGTDLETLNMYLIVQFRSHWTSSSFSFVLMPAKSRQMLPLKSSTRNTQLITESPFNSSLQVFNCFNYYAQASNYYLICSVPLSFSLHLNFKIRNWI